MPEGSGSLLRVLLADDTDDARFLVRRLLEAAGGFEVVAEARDGLETVREAERVQPDVVILDIAMPVMDGLEALPVLRRRCPDIRVLVLSVFHPSRMAAPSLDSGADAYLDKTSLDRLVPALRELVEQVPVETLPPMETPSPLEPPPAAEDLDRPPSVAGEPEVDETLQGLAHELGSPATVIRRLAEIVHDEGPTLGEEERRRFLESIVRNAAYMESMTRAIADAHGIVTRGLRLAPEKVELSSLIRETVDDLQEILAPHPLQLLLTEGTVMADPTRMRQAVSNLLLNAARYSPSGEPITLEVRPKGGGMAIMVTDSCGGIPDRSASVIFERFGRLRTEVAPPGLGLGLYIARGIARAHRGDLLLEPRVGEGCRFTLTVPPPG